MGGPTPGPGCEGVQDLAPHLLRGGTQVELGQSSIVVDQCDSDALAPRRSAEQREVGVNAAEEPRSLVLIEVANGGQRVMRVELELCEAVCGIFHVDVGGDPPVGVTGAQESERVSQELLGRRQCGLCVDEAVRDGLEDADVVVVSVGNTSRVAQAAIEQARDQGVKVGAARLVITWPFPAERIREIARTAKAILVPELNMGQIALEVERAVAGTTRVVGLPHAGGTVHEVETILDAILEAAR